MNDNKHSGYEAFADKWFKTRCAVEGQTAVHKAGEKFLPRLTDQTDNDYNGYKLRATYFNATGRTLDGLVGMVFRKEMKTDYPESLDPLVDDIDMAGNSLNILAMRTIGDIIQVGRAGILVEYPQVNEAPSSQADVARMNLRPYTTYYPAESILDWRVERVNNVMQPVMVKLSETYELRKNEFEFDVNPQIRALLLTEIGYVQRIYRKNDKSEWVQFGNDIVPIMKGSPIPFIPFWAFGAKENSIKLQDPPLLDLADMNLAHYRISADYERGCHFAGLPTPILAGFMFEEGAKISLGSTTALVTPDATAKWGFLEFTGQGLTSLKDNLKEKQAQMAALGSRILAPEKSGVESEGALLIRHAGENSVLSSIVELASENFEQILIFMGEWFGVTGDVEVDFNKDFLPVPMDAQQLDALMKAWQAGGIPQEELFHALKRGEVIRNQTTYDEYLAGIEMDVDSSISGIATDDDEPDRVGMLSQIKQRLGL